MENHDVFWNPSVRKSSFAGQTAEECVLCSASENNVLRKLGGGLAAINEAITKTFRKSKNIYTILSEPIVNPNSAYEPVLFETRTRSLAPSAELTILSPFTKECRAPGALTGTNSFLDCLHGAQPRKIKAEEAVILQTKRAKNLFDASHKEFAKSQRDRKLARSMP
jgi:hypothetical protein